MSRLSVLDYREMPGLRSFYESIALLPVAESYRLMHAIRNSEISAFEAEEFEQVCTVTRAKLSLVPALAGCDLDALARAHTEYLFTRNVPWAFFATYGRAREQINTLIRYENKAVIDQALSVGRGAILLPLHIGPYLLIAPWLANIGYPITSVLDHTFWPQLQAFMAVFCPQVLNSMACIPLPDQTVVFRCIRALRANRLVSAFPEFSLGTTKPKTRVPFCGTTVLAPEGLVHIAAAARVPMIPVTLTEERPMEFVFRFHDPIEVNAAHKEEGLAKIFAVIERCVLSRPAEWWCWQIIDEMIDAADIKEAGDRVS